MFVTQDEKVMVSFTIPRLLLHVMQEWYEFLLKIDPCGPELRVQLPVNRIMWKCNGLSC